MVCAQLVAFGRISQCREESRRRMRLKEKMLASAKPSLNGDLRHIANTKDLPNGDRIYMNGGDHAMKLSRVSEESYFG